MRHAVMFMMYNTMPEQLELSKQALASILSQDIGPLDVYICNNGSTSTTKEWLDGLTPDQENGSWLYIRHNTHNISPIKLVNDYFAAIFEKHDKVIGCPNDVILPSNFYRLANDFPRGFVTASQTENRNFPTFEKATAISECTPMAVAIIRRWFYDALIAKDGMFFDSDTFTHYASDCDMALRMAACGIRGVQLDLQYFHAGSASWKLANPEVGKAITDQADRDRSAFERKWGFRVDSLEYGQVAADPNFGKSKIWTEKPDGLTEFIESKIGKTDV